MSGRLTQKNEQGNWWVKGLLWKDLNIGTPITKKTHEKLYGCLYKLMKYEETGLSPDEVERLNTFDGSQAVKEAAAPQKERRKHKWVPAEKPPKENGYILISFENFSIPQVGRYEEDGGDEGIPHQGGIMLFFLCHMKSSCLFFAHYRKRWRTCRVRLCGVHKKNIWGVVNLHKLPGKSSKTITYQGRPVSKGYPFRKHALFPVVQEVTDDITTVAFIDAGVVIHEIFPSFSVFMQGNDINVFFGGCL